MKQTIILLITSIALLTACKHNQNAGIIEGVITGLQEDTIYLYGNDEFAHFMTPAAVNNGKFEFDIPMDTTLIQAMLYINENEQYPIYLERGKTITLKGDAAHPGRYDVEGNETNEELTRFMQTLHQTDAPADTLTLRLVEDYIRQNQRSLINIYLLARYFVDVPNPDLTKAKALIDEMDGALQDKPYIVELVKVIELAEKAEVNKSAPAFTLTNTEGKRISRTDFRDKYLLMNFWASWSDSSRIANTELRALYKAFPPRKENKNTNKPTTPELAILGISLDMDKVAWKAAIKDDTLKWEQASDLKGWSSPVVEQYAIQTIPYNVLVDNRGRIIARGIEGDELRQKLDSLLNIKK